MIKNTMVNNLITWISNQSNHDVCLRLGPVGCRSSLGSRLIDFWCMSNFVIKLAYEFLLIIIVGTPKLFIVIVKVISWVVWVEVVMMVKELITEWKMITLCITHVSRMYLIWFFIEVLFFFEFFYLIELW